MLNVNSAPGLPALFSGVFFATSHFDGQQSSHPSPDGSRADGKRKYRVIVIDDEQNIAESIAEILRGRGYDATAFYDGRSALEYAREHCPDMVVTDVVMPALNGIQTSI